MKNHENSMNSALGYPRWMQSATEYEIFGLILPIITWDSGSLQRIIFSFNISHAYFTAGCYLNECTLLRHTPGYRNRCQGRRKGENRIGNWLSRGGHRPGRLRLFSESFCLVILEFPFSHHVPISSWWIFDSIPRRWRWQKENRNLAQTKININHKWISSKRCSGKTRELYFLTARCMKPDTLLVHWFFRSNNNSIP